MTKTIDYSKTIIYKLVCNDLNITDVYVGHTTNFLKRRTAHKNKCNNEKDKRYNLKVYQMIRQNGGWVNWSMVEIEKFNCSDKNEAVKKERYYYELLNSTLNTNSPNLTKEDIKEKSKMYRTNNKEDIKKKRINNGDYFKTYYKDNKEEIIKRQKIYYEDKKEEITKRCKLYCKNNKEVLRQKQKIQYMKRKIKKLVVGLYYLIKNNNEIKKLY